ncbi:hypothetical protein [Chryseobacterium sp. Leaf394]|uniref:hypothetical protein n=1 Tax=Chryseobacterium sp. Leaf394 TaxID=1736361 RepID=UPI000B2952D4|nr:hypothetical protein [Chryseobacterium sp. Leaf394]
MKKEITKTIINGLLLSFLAGTISSIIILLIIQFQNQSHYDDERPRMDCFAGLGYGIIVGVHFLFVILSLPAFFNLFKTVREHRFYSFLSFFTGPFLYLILISFSLPEFSEEDFLFIIPWIFMVIWIYYYFKLQKIIKLKNE